MEASFEDKYLDLLPRICELKTPEEFFGEQNLKKYNKQKKWKYGYNEEYDVVIISKDGTVGDVIEIMGLTIALPATPAASKISFKKEARWTRKEMPEHLSPDTAEHFSNYIDEEYRRREEGFWYWNKGVPVYITGEHYMYLQWTKTDVGYPDYRVANRVLFLFWEACVADKRCYGFNYLKIRRSGASYMGDSACVNYGTSHYDDHVGMVSKSGTDAKSMFTSKVVPMIKHYPFFFQPMMDGSTNPRMEIAFRQPTTRITKNNTRIEKESGLNTIIDWRNTGNNAYDSEKLGRLLSDEAGKYKKPNNIEQAWRVQKTCLQLGRRIVGKAWMCSTANKLDEGGREYKSLYYDSHLLKSGRDDNGQTKSGLYALFINAFENYEGFIDIYGRPVINDPEEPVMGIDGEMIEIGSKTYLDNIASSLRGDNVKLNEHFRQFPRTEEHAFRDDAKRATFDLGRIYDQIDYNDTLINLPVIRGNFFWSNGVQDSEVKWAPDKNGKWKVTWIPDERFRNKIIVKNGKRYPGNPELGTGGADSYDIDTTVDGRGSNGALHLYNKYTMHSRVPKSQFVVEYINRPPLASIFYEDVLMTCIFYGYPLLAENNKYGIIRHFENRGYEEYAVKRPDYDSSKHRGMKTRGIPSNSQDVIQSHAAAIQAYIYEHVGELPDGKVGEMFFQDTLHDWADFDIDNRTKFDASISSGYALMLAQKDVNPIKKQSTIKVGEIVTRYRGGKRIR